MRTPFDPLDRRRLIQRGAAIGVASLIPAPVLALSRGAPPLPAAAVQRVLGEYGPSDAQLVVYEADGKAVARGLGFADTPLTMVTPMRFRSADGRNLEFSAHGVTVGGSMIPRRDIGDEQRTLIRARVKADPAELRRRALAATPPKEPPPARASDLVPLSGQGMRYDITYATDHGFMGIPIYERAGAFLQRPAAAALGRALTALRRQGYGLVIYDGYRPWFATWMFWEATPPDLHEFVADPAKGSRHNRGCAIDLGLVDLASGKVVPMPSRYDEMSIRSYADYLGGTSRERWHRKLLRDGMEAEGFTVYPQEWWHFDYKDWQSYGIGTASYSELAHSELANSELGRR